MMQNSDQLFESRDTWTSSAAGIQSILRPPYFVLEPNTRTFKELLQLSQKGISGFD